MKEEIKEILEEVKFELKFEKWIEPLGFDKEHWKLLLDYITNLQQENKILKELNICVGCENNPDYKSRCEKANKWVDKHTVIYTKNGISIIDWDNLSDPRKLKNILNGSDENGK